VNIQIEFCGVPGSGKSTLCKGVLHQLKKRGHVMMGREAMVDAGLHARNFGILGNFFALVLPNWRREFLGLPHGLNDWHRFVVDYPAFAAQVHNWLGGGGGDEVWRSCVFYSLLSTAFEFQLAVTAKQPVLLDEGFAQRFFTLRGYGIETYAGDAGVYAECMPRPSALLLMTTPPEICFSRVKCREQFPLLMQNKSELILQDLFTEGSVLLANLAEELEHRGVPVLRIDGSESLEPTVEKIVDSLESILS